ncbi:lactate utilization protein C [Thermoactinomyces sp. FSL K6-2592]|jgi:L-lactate dehydrogenase complex protein LldG|uniref:Lactate utilization protein C n=1 Tax=Thermoactinomyces vulgaris TaxID=2026 RepID=A0ABS0QGF4_THEVU|nr:lactate utilization protein C [Thermoactinomyces vulgaris]MBA4551829.1 lactate utilization protein C [Thermoactinomyces vulgaris]MBA4597160.1 lactate utilization protein C [Thermoactinomyces vulgaris]MBH8588302.1 lactate utilization protein C [Thermoactinomyces vulgaris]RMB01302.1 L-lactate dehydrogenase complex protein LldG [Thermoactinomyces vulgaris]
MQGTIHNRDTFLKNIARKLGRKQKTDPVPRPEWKTEVHQETLKDASREQLLEIFKKQCRNIHTTVIETTSEQLPETLKKLVSENGGGPVVISGDPRFQEYGLHELLHGTWPGQGISVYRWQEGKKEENIRQAASAKFGVVFCDHALAESGTVVLQTRDDQGRALHYLPENYIAIIPKETIVPRMTQAVHAINQAIENGQTPPSSIHFISGPSNSADIEMNLVVGVHGPLKAFYIIV